MGTRKTHSEVVPEHVRRELAAAKVQVGRKDVADSIGISVDALDDAIDGKRQRRATVAAILSAYNAGLTQQGTAP